MGRNILLFIILCILGYINCQESGSAEEEEESKPCLFLPWNFNNTLCPNGTQELYHEDDGEQSTRMCCNVKHEDYGDSWKNHPYNCRTTHCSDATSLCSTLDPRYVNNGTVLLLYDEIVRESCASGSIAICCVLNSTQGLLATTLGAEANEFPHQARLKLASGSSCGATIYNKNFVISASHCFVNTETGKLEPTEGASILIGTNIGEADANEFKYNIKRFIPHPQYSRLEGHPERDEDAPRWFNDIGLIEIDSEIKFGDKVKSIPIAPKGFNPLKYANTTVIVGWGTTDTLEVSDHLQKSNFIIRNDKLCFNNNSENAPHPDMHGMEQQLLCVGGILEGVWSPTAGGGDSGGPAICRGLDDQPLLCGVTSFGGWDDECRKNNDEANCPPSVYAEVSYFNDWIKKNAGWQDPKTFYQPCLYGEELKAKEYEHQVKITSKDGRSCGGTLIKPDIIVSAGQCVNGSGINDLKVEKGGNAYQVKSYKILDGFAMSFPEKKVDIGKQGNRVLIRDNYYKNDLAVIKLLNGTNVDAKSLPRLPDKNDSNWDVGMEYSFLRNTSNDIMRRREFKFISNEKCQRRMDRMKRGGMNITVDENILCGVENYSGGSLCDRELGGGVICKGRGGDEVLCAVQNFRLCEFSIPNAFLDLKLFEGWVKQVSKWM